MGRTLDCCFIIIIILTMDLRLVVRDFLFDLTTQNPRNGARRKAACLLIKENCELIQVRKSELLARCCQPQLPANVEGGAAAHIRGRIF